MTTTKSGLYWYGKCPNGHEHWHNPMPMGHTPPAGCLHAGCQETVEWKKAR